MAANDGVLTPGYYGVNPNLQPGKQIIGRGPTGNLYQSGPAVKPSTFRADLAATAPTSSFNQSSAPAQAMQWIPQQRAGSTVTTQQGTGTQTTTGQRGTDTQTGTQTRTLGAMPSLTDDEYAYEELDEGKVKSRTQEFSALGRREAKSNFQDLLSRIYGANPDDPYAKNLARKASQGFSIDTQRAISAGGREALNAGLQEQQVRNNRRMAAYQAAVNAVLGSATTTSTQTNTYGEDVSTQTNTYGPASTSTEYQYAPTPMQAMPTNVIPTASQRALSKHNPLSLGQPYTYG